MRRQQIILLGAALILSSFPFVSCSNKTDHLARLPVFSVTNDVVDGVRRETLVMTNGISFYFTTSDVVLWFNKQSSMVIGFDPVTREPTNILLNRPGSSNEPAQGVMDINADGVPEVRRIKGQASNEIFYRGEWYRSEIKTSKTLLIKVDGKTIEVEFDGRRWTEVSKKP